MVVEVIRTATDDKRKGLSRVILLKRIRENYNFGDIDAKSINTQLSLALKRGIAKEILKKAKEEGKGKNHYKMIETNIKVVKPKSKSKKATNAALEKPPVLKKSSSLKSKEKSSARRLSIGTPAKKVVSKVKKSEGSAKKAPAKAKVAKKVKEAGKKTPVWVMETEMKLQWTGKQLREMREDLRRNVPRSN